MRIRTLLFASVVFLALPIVARAQIAVRGDVVYTMAGAPITNGIVLIRDGKIEAVGPSERIPVPAGYRVYTAKVVTPGLIDAHSVVGLSGYLNQPHDQMQLEGSGPFQPELRAIDAYDARERLIAWVRSFGVTTLHTGHGPGAMVSGQTMIVKTVGDEVDQAVIVPTAMVAATFGPGGLASGGRSPGTRSKLIAMLRAELIKAQEYDRKQSAAKDDQKPPRELRAETMVRILKKELPLLITAQRAVDIMDALRLAKEFDIRIVLDGAAEAYLLVKEIKAAGVPVIIHPTMFRAGGDTENLSMETASVLRRAGIPIALQSSFEGYVPKTRVVLFEAGEAAANGLSFNEALATITIDAAKILGIDKRVGSLETGKDADVALYDGDPFEFTTHCIGVLVNGAVVSEEKR
ncbi:MAG: amidohydrolase family protein [Pyrinomonadaceae bacterium]